MARGNIISQSTHTVDSATTRTVLRVPLTVDMAPSARLLVYAIRDDGEVVADSLTISVGNAFQNKVYHLHFCTVIFINSCSSEGEGVLWFAREQTRR